MSDRLPVAQHVRGQRQRPGGNGISPRDGKPQFVFVGITKPDESCRLYASRTFRKPPGWRWDADDTGPAFWSLNAELDKTLVVDAPTWNEAMARVFEIWSNEDREAARLAQLEQEQGQQGIPDRHPVKAIEE